MTPPGIAPISPLDADTASEVMVTLAPSSSGPRVIDDQYNKTRRPSGRRARTRQMPLSVRSMVAISASVVTSRTITPRVPRRLACPANCVR